MAAILAVIGIVLWNGGRATAVEDFKVLPRTVQVQVEPSLAVGPNFAAMVAPDGSLWVWGSKKESFVDLGISDGWKPQRLGADTDWKEVTAGFYGLIALKQNGTLWGLGNNGEGMMGLGTARAEFTQLTRLDRGGGWKTVKAGVAHCLALKTDGTLWAWGKNHDGQVGVGQASPGEPMRQVGSDTNWAAISPGAMTSFALKTDGTLWGWGYQILSDKPGERTAHAPIQLEGGTNWVSVSSGEYHVAALDRGGFTWVMGPNTGQITPDAPKPYTNWFRLKQGGVQRLISGQDCIMELRDSGWSRMGDEAFTGVMPWKPPIDFDPLAVHSQRGTTLYLMRDGRLWTLERRVGAREKEPVMQRFRSMVLSIMGKGGGRSFGYHVDGEPALIWEQE